MNIAKCLNRHYYDRDKFSECPTCKKGDFDMNKWIKPAVVEETQILDYKKNAMIDNNPNGKEPTVVMNEDQTMILEEDKTQILDDNK